MTAARRRPTDRRPKHRRRTRVILASALAVIIAGTATAEAVTRHAIDSRITAAAHRRLTGPIGVGIGLTPALLDAATGQIAGVTVTAPSTSVCGLHDIDATATLDGVRIAPGTVTVQRTAVSIVLPVAALAGQVAARYPRASITPDPATQSLSVRLGSGGMVLVSEQASLTGDTITLSPSSASVLGNPVPLTAPMRAQLAIRRTLSGLPFGLSPRSLSVTDSGLQIDLAGGPTTLKGRKDTPAGPSTCALAKPSD